MLPAISDGAAVASVAVYALAMVSAAAETAVRSRAAATPADAVGSTAPVEIVAGTAGGGPVAAPVRAPSGPDRGPGGGRRGAGARGVRLARVTDALVVLGIGANLLALVARALAAGRAPWGNMYEFALAAALATAVAHLVLTRRAPVRALGPWVLGTAALLVGLATTVLYTEVGALVPALNSAWLVVHVAAAIVAGGMFTVGAGVLVLFLVRERHERRSGGAAVTGRRFAAHLPRASTLESVAQSVHVFAFPIWTFAVIAGAIWAEESWGRYWGWDPKETWAFITWVLYAAFLHARSTAGWRRRASWFALGGWLALVFNFFGVNLWITGLHSYAGV